MARKRRLPGRKANGQFKKRGAAKRKPAKRKRRSPRRVARRNPPKRRRRRAPARRTTYRARRKPARRRRRARRNPPMNPFMMAALTAFGLVAADGVLSRFLPVGMLRAWAPVALKAGVAFMLNRKAKTRPAAIAAAALLVYDASRSAGRAAGLLPESAGFVTLPPGLAGQNGFPSAFLGAAPGIPARMGTTLQPQAYGMALAGAYDVDPLGSVL